MQTMARQAVRLNACTEIALTKLDVLDELETIKVCVAYEVEGERYEYLPHSSGECMTKPCLYMPSSRVGKRIFPMPRNAVIFPEKQLSTYLLF